MQALRLLPTRPVAVLPPHPEVLDARRLLQQRQEGEEDGLGEREVQEGLGGRKDGGGGGGRPAFESEAGEGGEGGEEVGEGEEGGLLW